MHLEPVDPKHAVSLRDKDAHAPKGVPSDGELKARVDKETERIAELQRVLYADARYALLIILQGRDAAGKDGTIRSVFSAVNPQGCQVTSFGPPSEIERKHDFLWRVHQNVPALGMMGIFNRSHYEDVIVTRVRNHTPKRVYGPRYAEINDFERMLTEQGTVILKFFLHISREEQLARLEKRLSDESKNWKFQPGDLDDRALWPSFTKAYQDALRKCSTAWAPWYVVPADDKKVRNWLIARTIARTLKRMDLRYPPASESVGAAMKLERS
jgi:PPK2 family polyphosphate:nucleotide phosphotransferase